MKSMQERLAEEMKEAMKARDDLRLSTIRMVRSSVKNKEIEKRRELDEQEMAEVISSLVKQRRESIRMFADAGRADLVAKEERELEVLSAFLPPQLSEEEIGVLVAKAVTDTAATGASDMGRVMKALMPLVSGKADGRVVSDLVKRALT
jgi:uncharacterized protein YqeY